MVKMSYSIAILVVIGMVAVVSGATLYDEEPASIGQESEHMVIAEPIENPPANTTPVDFEDSRLAEQKSIHQAVENAAASNQFVKVSINDTEYSEIKSTLSSMRGYKGEADPTGILVTHNDTVVRVNHRTASAS